MANKLPSTNLEQFLRRIKSPLRRWLVLKFEICPEEKKTHPEHKIFRYFRIESRNKKRCRWGEIEVPHFKHM